MSEEILEALGRVERAIKDKWSTPGFVLVLLVGTYLGALPGRLWHSKWRYASEYNISSERVYVAKVPHDCEFLAAPLGEKNCHYERTVSTIRWATSTTGNPIVSYDEGKTWTQFTPDSATKVPAYSTVEEVYISWEKKDD